MPPARSHDEYTLYIRLAEIEPAIWRRIVAPGYLTLHQLHQVLQVTMGWTHSHLHQFIVPGENESTRSRQQTGASKTSPNERLRRADHGCAEKTQDLIDWVGDGGRAAAGEEQANGPRIRRHVLHHE